MRNIFFMTVLLAVICFLETAFAQDPVSRLKDETLSYFKPLKGRVISLSGGLLSCDLGAISGIKQGMRVSVLREGEPFLHPITKEPIGKTEAVVGIAEVKEVRPEGSSLAVVSGDVMEGDLVRISETKVRVFFFQDSKVDWGLAEHYHRLLKESGRVELIDTSLDSGDDPAILAEAKKKDSQVALVLRADDAGNFTVLRQRLFWVVDSARLDDQEMRVDKSFIKELHLGDPLFSLTASAGGALFFFDLPFRGRLVASADLNGDGQQELIITSDRYVRVFAPGASLLSLYEIKGDASDDYLWIDALDIYGDGKDEIILTSMNDGEIVSYIYGLRGSGFSLLWKAGLFLRKLGTQLLAQGYAKGEGFEGPVYTLLFRNGEFRKGDVIKLPVGVNIYDFVPIEGFDGMNYTFAYDEKGYPNLYNKEGLKVWGSNEDLGGFETSFKKDSPTIMVDRGVWTVKDRLISRNKEAFTVKRIPLANMARGLGYSSSQIRALFWTGLSMEERVLVDGISGSVLDYAISGDRLIVLSKPLFGIKAKNILKGESPLGSMLYVYSLKGR